jgi:hypothetical protein
LRTGILKCRKSETASSPRVRITLANIGSGIEKITGVASCDSWLQSLAFGHIPHYCRAPVGWRGLAGRKSVRKIVLSATLTAAPLIAGCAAMTPVLITERHVAVGLWVHKREPLRYGVQLERLEGAGIGMLDGTLVVGYHESTRIDIRVDQAPNGHLQEAWGSLWWGTSAVDPAGIEYVRPSVSLGELRHETFETR